MKRFTLAYWLPATILALLQGLFLPPAMANDQNDKTMDIRLPITSVHTNSRDSYNIALLKLLLKKVGIQANLLFVDKKFTQARIIEELSAKEGRIDAYWMGTSKEIEDKLITIRYPIYRGLLGYRIFIINKNDQDKLANVKSLKDLQALTGIQGNGWSDVEILNHSKLFQKTSQYDNIFKMINAGGRADYFSRGANEAFSEISARISTYPNLTVDQNVLLVYPFAAFIFVSPNNPKLAHALNEGFKKAYDDGSFMEFFNKQPSIKSVFEQAQFEKRVRIDIPNPLISEETLQINKQYWH